MKKRMCRKNRVAWFVLCLSLFLLAGCGKTKDTGKAETKTKNEPSTEVEALAEVNPVPEDGIVTKEQFQTVAGKDMQVQFTGQTEEGITYVWTYDASKIQNPQDQNLNIDFIQDGLEEIKKQANNAEDALGITMYGKGVITPPVLQITLPASWKSDAGVLLKEQKGKLAKMSDVTIVTEGPETKENETVLTMTITSLDGECYVAGGRTKAQNGLAAANGNNGQTTQNADESENADENTETGAEETSDAASAGNTDQSTGSANKKAASDVPADKAGDQEMMTCTISIRCDAILDNMDKLAAGKEAFVPSNGQILAESTVEFQEGDTVFDVLQSVCKETGIHMEYSNNPVYDSAYIEGINQLYEFDCGEQSGWMYNVNGWFPNYGCSKYTVSAGDDINWVYTCTLGKDVGDNSMQ